MRHCAPSFAAGNSPAATQRRTVFSETWHRAATSSMVINVWGTFLGSAITSVLVICRGERRGRLLPRCYLFSSGLACEQAHKRAECRDLWSAVLVLLRAHLEPSSNCLRTASNTNRTGPSAHHWFMNRGPDMNRVTALSCAVQCCGWALCCFSDRRMPTELLRPAHSGSCPGWRSSPPRIGRGCGCGRIQTLP